MTPIFQNFPCFLLVFHQQMLDIDLLFLVTGECNMKMCQSSIFNISIQFFLIQVVFGLTTAAIIQNCVSHWLTWNLHLKYAAQIVTLFYIYFPFQEKHVLQIFSFNEHMPPYSQNILSA